MVVSGELPHERGHLRGLTTGAEVHHSAANLGRLLEDHATETPDRGLEHRDVVGTAGDVMGAGRDEPEDRGP